MKLAIACDHGGLVLKQSILDYLEAHNIKYKDFGIFVEKSVDYPDYAYRVAKKVADKEYDLGILLCGTGIGISIAANKVKGIRCANIDSPFTAEMCKAHNNANIIAMGGRVISPEVAVQLTDIWLNTQFQGDRHQRRINKIREIEEKQ